MMPAFSRRVSAPSAVQRVTGALGTYENGLLFLLGLSFAILCGGRSAGSLLTPFIKGNLDLTNARIGLLSAGLSLTWAFSAYGVGRWSDAMGARKPFLVASLVLSAAGLLAGAAAKAFPLLLLSRVALGAVGGAFLPISLALMMSESSPTRRGLNAGILQKFFPSLISGSLAPVVLIATAARFGWRTAFVGTAIVTLLTALCVILWVREAPATLRAAKHDDPGRTAVRVGALLRKRNIWVCCLVSIFMFAWFDLNSAFMPLFLTSRLHLSTATMSYLMTTNGIASALAGFLAPAISDRCGRRSAVIAFCLLGAVAPLAPLLLAHSIPMLATIMILGWLGTGAFPLIMGVIPVESLPFRLAASAMGLIICVGELFGGFSFTYLAGQWADRFTLQVPILLAIGCAATAGVFALLLRETAPLKVRSEASQIAALPSIGLGRKGGENVGN